MTSTRLNIVCIATVRWDNPFLGNRQQVARALAEEHNVLYVHLPIKTSFRRSFCRKNRKKEYPDLLRQAGDGSSVLLYTPAYNFLPFLRFRMIKKIRDWLLARKIKKILRNLGWNHYLVWTYYFGSGELIRNLDPDFSVYDCVDNHAGYALSKGDRKSARRIRNEEDDLLRRVDLTVALSPATRTAKEKITSPVVHVSGGVEFSHFHRAAEADLKIPEELKKITRPVAGFIGSIRPFRFDAELIERVAAALPDLSIILIGDYRHEDDPAIERLTHRNNIHLLGHRPYSSLPGYLKFFDLAIIPYPVNPHTDYIYPLKYLECLAAGKAVVTTAIGGLRGADFSRLLSVADGGDEFIEKIKSCLSHDPPEEREKRIAFARAHTWRKRADTILEIIDRERGEK